ncbi:histidine phosphatase family protein [Nocardia cyriacigeorgica]|jgi:broad specificity phosphatase PhoE|uniref:histidine phosphatase family protein n=2 Tax=Nocardia cyriacigeorgica TaxID=135487 RepID=UPI00031F9552|nr:histidine phosphatase family protein [Nocardia cyriacigeorgica]AVH24088.1 histidine phosphatase family protein [Nocardia cyriacigeorgica]MBF6326190.1 histidine phosphatase family protein [Nocardia cyriacigeorgica]MBF6499158.1 histidine phosphatase family protein [Nocardia cyriacigeorgica]PPJ08922.1 histidine phosphatase family protein [Nocardia cyriacigeorgica]TLF59849.1 histidine phosphatase family protein [Nocardia cyriacigeorgica]
MNLMKSRLFAMIATVIAAVAVMAAGAGSAAAAPQTGEMFLTFVRHGESAGNNSGLIDTSVPGPELTEKGRAQAAAVSQLLADCKFDGVYASTMVRTQQTAEPTSQLCGHSTVVEEGLHEIEAGIYEGTPEKDAREGYLAAPIQWLQGNLDARIPGSINGHEFKKRMDNSLQDIKDRGSKRAVIFSHGGAIMFWTLMSVSNPDMSKLQTDPLHNTGRVVVKGTPAKGWKLVSWDGHPAG